MRHAIESQVEINSFLGVIPKFKFLKSARSSAAIHETTLASRLSTRCRRGITRIVKQDLVEPAGIEPATPCLQSRCSPS